MSPVRLISLPRATMTERRELQQSCLGHVQCTVSTVSVHVGPEGCILVVLRMLAQRVVGWPRGLYTCSVQ